MSGNGHRRLCVWVLVAAGFSATAGPVLVGHSSLSTADTALPKDLEARIAACRLRPADASCITSDATFTLVTGQLRSSAEREAVEADRRSRGVTVESTMESVTIRGTVAIVRDRWRFKRPDGTATEWRLGTSVWVKNDAQWQLAAFQASPVGQEDVQPQAVAAARAIGTTGKVTPPPTGGVEREVWKANEGITTAFERRDARAWSALTADGYVAVYPDGSMEAKSARLKMLESNTLERTPGSAPTRWQDVRIRVFGDTAILTAVQVRGTADDPIARRLTRVFVRDDGWRQLGVHFTLVTAE